MKRGNEKRKNEDGQWDNEGFFILDVQRNMKRRYDLQHIEGTKS
jgi:hypothetical protein